MKERTKGKENESECPFCIQKYFLSTLYDAPGKADWTETFSVYNSIFLVMRPFGLNLTKSCSNFSELIALATFVDISSKVNELFSWERRKLLWAPTTSFGRSKKHNSPSVLKYHELYGSSLWWIHLVTHTFIDDSQGSWLLALIKTRHMVQQSLVTKRLFHLVTNLDRRVQGDKEESFLFELILLSINCHWMSTHNMQILYRALNISLFIFLRKIVLHCRYNLFRKCQSTH